MFLAEEKRRRLTPQQLAIGEQLIHSSKAARDLEEFGWNKYAFLLLFVLFSRWITTISELSRNERTVFTCRFMNNDEDLPDWFAEDERKHYRKNVPVTKVNYLHDVSLG